MCLTLTRIESKYLISHGSPFLKEEGAHLNTDLLSSQKYFRQLLTVHEFTVHRDKSQPVGTVAPTCA
jgi:hypothetical protein